MQSRHVVNTYRVYSPSEKKKFCIPKEDCHIQDSHNCEPKNFQRWWEDGVQWIEIEICSFNITIGRSFKVILPLFLINPSVDTSISNNYV